MKPLITALAVWCAVATAHAQCPQSTTRKFVIPAVPYTITAGQTVALLPVPGEPFPRVSPLRMQARIPSRGTVLPVVDANESVIHVLIPPDVPEGVYEIAICIADGPYATTDITVKGHRDTLDTDVNKTDPDPRTQNGKRKDLSDAGRRPQDFPPTSYPNGGHGGTLTCEDRHRIDGAFTRLSDGSREWSGITPMVGRFSHLYLDYCAERKTMYLLNDWLIGTSSYERNCYNLFDFTTGNGAEHWRIKVTHDSANPVIVVLNGVDVTKDTSLVRGGGFGFGPSPSDTTPHTIYEFGVKVKDGLFIIPTGSDPVQYIPSTRTSLECDANGVEGYGLVREPTMRRATFSDTGITTQQYERYIPQGGVVGLEKEPNDIAGVMDGTTITYRSGSQDPVTNVCTGVGVIDGAFTPEEWSGAVPASGMFSDLYAQYCNGELHILNDWIYATERPSNATCYNLFELYTGDGSEHWGIWVWQDSERRPTVIRNGKDVSADTSIVELGKAGWGSSARMAKPHAIYEFKIRTKRGGFALQYADPGPASFCSNDVNRTNEEQDTRGIILRPSVIERLQDIVQIVGIQQGTTIHLIDIHGRIVASDRSVHDGVHALRLPSTLASGRYTVRLTHPMGTISLPLLIMM